MTTERLAELEETVHQLRTDLKLEPEKQMVDALQIGLNLTRYQAIILAALCNAGSSWMTKERLNMALPDADERDPSTVRVHICRIRDALGPDAIIHYLDVGYTLGAPGVMACKRAFRKAGL